MSDAPTPSMVLQLDGFEGPMDLLLDLARAQKVDLARISILSLVEQYLAIMEGARRVRLELAADWLVMAAWLTWLKSRLLLPAAPGVEPAEEPVEALAARLAALEQVQAASRWLGARPQLGLDVLARGRPEAHVVVDRSGLAADVAGLMRGYVAAARRGGARRGYRPPPMPLWTMADALARLTRMLGTAPGWMNLAQFLPAVADDPRQWRAALASTLLAGLELAKAGAADLRQEAAFAPIFVRGAHAG